MGQIADDMIEGYCCSSCGQYFTEINGIPSLCEDCYLELTPRERRKWHKSDFETL
jgi:predicted amidophosphoribosyltransferase